jgi:hypothetical protein
MTGGVHESVSVSDFSGYNGTTIPEVSYHSRRMKNGESRTQYIDQCFS